MPLRAPAAMKASTGLTDDACTRTSSWSSASSGAGRSSRSAGAASKLSKMNPRIAGPFGEVVATRAGRARPGVDGDPAHSKDSLLRGRYA
jgi:hypothetical protein